jgi:hypothetical protein
VVDVPIHHLRWRSMSISTPHGEALDAVGADGQD